MKSNELNPGSMLSKRGILIFNVNTSLVINCGARILNVCFIVNESS